MIRLTIAFTATVLAVACQRPAPSMDVFGDEEAVDGVRLGMRADEYRDLHTPQVERRFGYEDRVSDSLYYRFSFEPRGATRALPPPDTATLTSVARHRIVQDDAEWEESVLSIQERLGPPTACFEVFGIRVNGRWAEWHTPPTLSIGYAEEVRADARLGGMVQEQRIETTLGATGRPGGRDYRTSEIACPAGQSASASST